MKTLIAIMLLFAAVGPSNGQTPEHSASVKRLLQRYDDYAQVQPILVNEGSSSIYLDPFSAGVAAVHRFDRTTRKWREWGGLSECGVVQGKQVEIKPGDEYKVFVNWGAFIVENPPPGSYKLQVSYSLEPWSIEHRPENIYVAESGEFRMTKSRPPRWIPGRRKRSGG